ncbi:MULTISPECIES: hypothetical protein [Trichocoleus]|uniref:Uncharacterized protein n=1 Tax=Trichocoleus desertorum GB2-A4 TaxID=2933944 RepID=A0ABV0JCP8_9CYAN|nr:hypothetical protein [Trichocoleus sp. FACHB-46]MBD1864212.1 hypothetical protein [Trichocoleus sp. FACHB-46]
MLRSVFLVMLITLVALPAVAGVTPPVKDGPGGRTPGGSRVSSGLLVQSLDIR